jgi:signal transduction histidine kinase/CheY-like chemotaxis protein
VNRAACYVFGRSFDELLGNKLDIFFDDETAAHVEKDCIPLVRSRGKQEFLLPMRGMDGRPHFMRLSMFVIRALSGGIGIIGIDETEKTLIERERAEALEEAKRASQAKSDFLAHMSHEMRTPMNAIIGMTSIAKSTGDSGRKDYCLKKIEDASNHLLGVINDILDMSKIEANKFELSPVKFNFDKMLQKIVNVINFRVDEKKLKLTAHVDSHIPLGLVGDDQRLSQVIANLMSNAVKFTPEGGVIRLDARLEDETDGVCTIRTDVSDNGIGITQEQKNRLFTSFEQAESGTSRKFGGTGLGLAISKRIVEMMGGKIWVESEPGAGSTFSFTVRVESAREETGATLWKIQRKDLRMLVVDDDRDLLEYFADIASRLGVKCDTAISGEEACRMLDRGYDIYFIDWNMPVMNGIELARHIKSMDSGYSIVIMISSTEWQAIAEEAKHAGVDKFLPKPIFISALADCINECIGSGAAAAESRAGAEEESDFEGYTILLAEDVEVNREILLALLEPTKIVIHCAENGQEAVDMFKADPNLYDMVFMDVQMPMMDGYNATRQIRASGLPRAREITIVAMTANVFREDVERCLASGMNDHVGKPLDLGEVIGKLRKYLPACPVSQGIIQLFKEPPIE